MRRILILASLLALLDTLLFSILSPLLTTYADELDLSRAEIGLLSSAYAWGAVAAAIPAGFLAQRLGSRRVICGGLIALSTACLVVGWISDVVALDLGRCAQGFCAAVIWAGAMAWLIATIPEEQEQKGAAIGAAGAAGGFGALIGPTVGALGVAIGSEWLFTGIAFLLLPVCACVATSEQGHEDERQTARDVVSAVMDRHIFVSFVFLAAPAVGFGFLLTLAPLKIDELGGGAGLVAVAFIAAGVVETVLAPVAGHWSDRVGRRTPYLCGLAVFCVGLATMASTDSLVVAVMAVPLGSIGGGLFIIPAYALFSDTADHTGLGQAHGFALSNTAFSLGLALGAYSGGLIAGAGGIDAPFYVVIGLLACLSIFASRNLGIGIEGRSRLDA